jgi:hypothetical protein
MALNIDKAEPAQAPLAVGSLVYDKAEGSGTNANPCARGQRRECVRANSVPRRMDLPTTGPKVLSISLIWLIRAPSARTWRSFEEELFDHPVGSARPSIGSGMAKPSALPAFRSNVGRGFLSTRTSSLMRRNNCLRAVSCFNFSLFHFCHTLDDSSSSPQEQTEQIL